MTQKIRVAILFGGRSAEHEVSLQSARNVFDAIDKNKYEIILIGIDHEGKWHLNDAGQFLLNAEFPDRIKLKGGSGNLALIPGETTHTIVNVKDRNEIGSVDVAFPILHGPFGEDGTVQGLLKLADIPFVGSDVLGSAVGMDKDVMKRLLEQANIPQAKFITLSNNERESISYQNISRQLGVPFFVKPANSGSSIGIGKVHSKGEFSGAIAHAFEFDNKIIVEEFIRGREIECSVLGNENPITSLPGEVIARHEFYDYDAKYLDQDGARLEIPAKISAKTISVIQNLAIKVFKTLCCSGMARVDFFLKENGDILVNELNTIPGFTKISMYPKMWEASGISYSQLIDQLIQLALEKYQVQKRLKFSAKP
jgi:D-alanine-D-alanine ligase